MNSLPLSPRRHRAGEITARIAPDRLPTVARLAAEQGSSARRSRAVRSGAVDIKAVEIEVAGRTVRVSSPDKPYFAERGLTKLDVVNYFAAVGPGILGALQDRPTTWSAGQVVCSRAPKLSTRQDNRGDAFYQKRVPKGAPEWVETATITFPSGRPADEVCPTELAVVAWAANLGTLTFHPWPVRRLELESGPAADRPGPAARHRLLARRQGCAGAARDPGRGRDGGLPEDVRPRPARVRADPAALVVHRGPPGRDRRRPRAGPCGSRTR